jgi:nucleolar protein 56
MDLDSPCMPDLLVEKRRYWYGDKTDAGWKIRPQNSDILLDYWRKYSSEFWFHPSWEDAVKSGFCKSRDEYYSLLRDLAIAWSKQEIQAYHTSEEVRLIKLVMILRETDLMSSRISEQISFWYRMVNEDIENTGTGETIRDPILGIASGEGTDGISLLCRDIIQIRASRMHLSEDISGKAEKLLPNTSALVGPLVAARLLAAAGSLQDLSRMPASRIQILGAHNAIFSHLSTGSPPPKHGLIFEHKRVHAAPRKVRGRVSRTLAANLAIAARIDYYRKCLDPVFLEKARIRIKIAGGMT